MKTFLFPEILRRGQPVQVFVERERVLPKKTVQFYDYYLVIDHELYAPEGAPRGVPCEYRATSRQVISKRLYETLVAESKRNHRRYQPSRRQEAVS